MEKVKGRILIIILVFVGLLCIFTKNSSAAFTLNGATINTDGDFTRYVLNHGSEFLNTPIKDLIGKTMAPGGSSIENMNATCLYHTQSSSNNSIYKILGIIDIEGSNLKIDGESKSLDNDAQKKVVANMGYGAYLASHNNTHNIVSGVSIENDQKSGLRYVFVNDFKSIIGNSFPAFYQGSLNAGNARAATLIKKYSYKSMEKDTENTPKIKKYGDQRYIGPLKVRFSGYDMEKMVVKINGVEVNIDDAYYTKKNGKYTRHAGIKNIPTSKSFYIKIPDGTPTTSKWHAELVSEKINNYRSRIALLYDPASGGQNIAVYWGDEKSGSHESVEWGEEGTDVPPEEGKLIIKKKKAGTSIRTIRCKIYSKRFNRT